VIRPSPKTYAMHAQETGDEKGKNKVKAHQILQPEQPSHASHHPANCPSNQSHYDHHKPDPPHEPSKSPFKQNVASSPHPFESPSSSSHHDVYAIVQLLYSQGTRGVQLCTECICVVCRSTHKWAELRRDPFLNAVNLVMQVVDS